MVALTLMLLLLFNVLGFALPALIAAWLMSWLWDISFSQGVWLSLGTIITVEYIIQTITDLPGQVEFGLVQRLVSTFIAYIFLALSTLAAWLLLSLVAVEISRFEATLLFTISLVTGVFFLFRSGTMGLPRWMTLPVFDLEEIDDYEDEDYIITPPKKQPRRKARGKRRGTN